MSYIKIAFDNKLIDPGQEPTFRIIESLSGPRIELTLGILTAPIGPPNEKTKFREALLDRNIYSKSAIAAVGLQIIGEDDPSSTITVVFKATIETKIPGTGGGGVPRVKTLDLDTLSFE